MAIITKRYAGKNKEYIYYTQEEADGLNINYKLDWREAQEGDWLLTDDGYVTKCEKRLSYIDPNQLKHCVTKEAIIIASGGCWTTQSKCLLFKKTKRLLGHRRIKEFVKAYVMMRLEGKIDYHKLGQMTGYQEVPALYAKRILKYKGIKEMINKELEEVLLKNGVTQDYLIQKWKKAMEIAETNGSAETMLKAFNSMKDVANLVSKSEIRGEFTYYGDINKKIADTEQQLLREGEIKGEPNYQVED